MHSQRSTDVARTSWIMSFVAVCAALSASAQASRGARDITIEVVDSHGAVFQQVPAKRDGRAYRAYLEAERDARYRIRITNSTGGRVGVVVTVDGRNIISGARSELDNDEPMYILGAGSTEEFAGWRANLSEVNEFYFTDWKDSYAEAFGDRSARGVIAVAVYREKEARQLFGQRQPEPAAAPVSPESPAADAEARAGARGENAASSSSPLRRDRKAEASEAGTGYGDRRVEHATQIAFDAEPRASQRVFLKYEWRETLCSKKILSCDDSPNRFWPGGTYGFAPPPPHR